ncbi:hypothetical protein HPB50_027836 [Hyalomma asiaticum]|nr:hypothetical protein HPB50_027836 [Hyalomma asiaticum]
MLALALILITMLALLVPTIKKIRRVITTCDEPPATLPPFFEPITLERPQSIPLEAVVTKPVHCTYHCRQAPGTPVGVPPDGLCDFVYFQNPKDFSLAEYGNSGCSTLMTTSAAKAQKTLYGISIYSTMAEKSEQELWTTAGIRKFKALWDSNVTCHGINFYITNVEQLKKFVGFSFLKRTWYLQRLMAAVSEKMWLVPYNLGGIYLVSRGYKHEWKNITHVLTAFGRNFKINLLVFNTHSMKFAPQVPFKPFYGEHCVVAGPTPFQDTGATSELTLHVAKDMLKHVTLPSYVRVLVSFSAAVHEFVVVYPYLTSVYGAECVSQDFAPYDLTCTSELKNREHESEPDVETAIRMGQPEKAVVWELAVSVLKKGSNGRRFFCRTNSVVSRAMATDSSNETSCPGVPHTSGTPPPSAAGDFRPTPSAPVAIVRTGRLPMSAPSERYVLPFGDIDQCSNVTIGSPSTPPDYYFARTSARKPPTNRIARVAAAALESNRDRQPLLTIDAYTVPLQDGTVSPTLYCTVGLVFAGVCVAAALVLFDVTGRQPTTSTDLQSKERHPQPETNSTDLGHNPPDMEGERVTFSRSDRQHTSENRGLNIFELFSKPANSVDTAAAANVDTATVTTAVGSWTVEKRSDSG